MTSRRAFVPFVLSLSMTFGCNSRPHPSPQSGASPVAVARVDDDVVDVATVAHIASAQGVTPAVALERAVSDAVMAASAKERFGDARLRQARRGALARLLLQGFADRARSQGPPTDDEVARATEKRWWELDRPRLVRTTHAVVLVKTKADDARAKAVALRIAERVATTSEPVAFKAAAAQVPTDGFEVRVEDLPPLTRDGKAVDIDSPEPVLRGSIVPEFADAAFSIPAVGRTSPVVHTEYGYHVILAVAWVPEHRVPLEERRTLLSAEILNGRATALSDAALAHAKSVDTVSLERSAVDSMLQIKAMP